MLTGRNMKSETKISINEVIFNDEFIEYINTLSDSIKEFYKVSKNVNKNKNMLMNLSESEINKIDSILNNILKEKKNFNELNSINLMIEKLREIFNKIQLNIISEEKNLIFFFEDAKVLFKKMKEKRQEIILKLQKRANSTSRNKNGFSNVSSQYNVNLKPKIEKKSFNDYNRSEINYNIKSFKNRISDLNIKNQKNFLDKQKEIINMSNNKKKSKTLNKNNNSINRDYFDSFENMNKTNSISNINKVNPLTNSNTEIERLKATNKKLTLELKKYKINKLDTGNEHSTSKEKNDINISNQDKDKIISTLKEEINKNNKKYFEITQNFKNEIKKLQDENNKLKQKNLLPYNQYNINRENEKDHSEYVNNLIKRNNLLKNDLDEVKINKSNILSELNNNINIPKYLNCDNNILILEKEIELLRKKNNFMEKKLEEKQVINNELKCEINVLKNKHESEISLLSKKNTELSNNLINKQNDLLNLQKENLNKIKELENLKISIDSIKQNTFLDKNEKQKFLTNSYNEGQNIYNSPPINKSNNSPPLNIIVENYKKENEILKNNNNVNINKIKYYQNQIKKIKNELFEKDEINIDLKNQNQKNIKELKENYENAILQINDKNKILENSIEEYQNFNNDLSQQICNLNQQIVSKDVKLLELNYQIELLQKKLNEKEEENNILIKNIEELNNKLSNNINNINNNDNINEQIEKLKEQLQEKEKINNNLNNELIKLKNEKELLKNMVNKDKTVPEYNSKINIVLNDEIEKIKNEKLSLKSNIEKLTNQLKDSQMIYNENEGLKQLISKMTSEKEKMDDEMDILKRENEKIKNQIIRLSKNLPEEYNELQKQYNNLENKYLQEVKNKNNKSSPSKTKKLNNEPENNEEKLMNELKEAKKEIEIIKKKNLELFSQLEEKEIKKNCITHKSEDGNRSNYEEEFDLRKLAKGALDKNRSQDINIDYPGIQSIKEKYRELDFYYNSLETLVKQLLLNIQCNPKNKTYVTELCRIVGFDLETTNKILTNKNKKLILGIFPK